MTLIRNEILPGVWLTCITTDKFKTGCLSISLLTQLQRDTAAMNALIPWVLRRGTRQFPDMEQLAGELERIFYSRLEARMNRQQLRQLWHSLRGQLLPVEKNKAEENARL